MLEVLFEDNHMLVLNKPASLLTQPTDICQVSLETLAKKWLKEKYNKKGNVFLEAVHRLDKVASGIVVFAKTSKALSRLMKSVRERKTRKMYLAYLDGIPKENKGTLENYLMHDDYISRVVDKNAKGAKLARLNYRVIKEENERALVEIELESGRYHQIRVQFAFIGCPVVGDRKYGYESGEFEDDSIALHHFCMEIPHPTKNIKKTFISSPSFA